MNDYQRHLASLADSDLAIEGAIDGLIASNDLKVCDLCPRCHAPTSTSPEIRDGFGPAGHREVPTGRTLRACDECEWSEVVEDVVEDGIPEQEEDDDNR